MTEIRADFEEIAKRFHQAVPGTDQLWFRNESDGILDLRFNLTDNSWATREAAIDKIVELINEEPDVFINFSFVLPDVAYEPQARVSSPAKVHSFA